MCTRQGARTFTVPIDQRHGIPRRPGLAPRSSHPLQVRSCDSHVELAREGFEVGDVGAVEWRGEVHPGQLVGRVVADAVPVGNASQLVGWQRKSTLANDSIAYPIRASRQR